MHFLRQHLANAREAVTKTSRNIREEVADKSEMRPLG